MFPSYVIEGFERVSPNAIQEMFYGAWNTTLAVVFPLAEDYEIAPCFQVGMDDADFVMFAVVKKGHPVFFAEIKAQCAVDQPRARMAADDQMRLRFAQLFEKSPPSRLHGVSAFGPILNFYSLDKNTMEIFPKPSEGPSSVKDPAPRHWWNLTIQEEAGYRKFMEVAADTKINCDKLEEA